MTRVAVLDDWQGVAESLVDWSALTAKAEVTFFRAAFANADEVVAQLAGYDVILAMRERTPLSKQVIDRLPKLRLISFTGPRNAAVDAAACTARGILVCNTVATRSSHDTAELALGLLLAAARHLPLGDAEMRAGRFQDHVPPGLGLFKRTLGLIGLGRIGAQVASYGRALGMEVLAWSQNLTEERALEAGATRVGKDELLARADAISLHLVLSDRSRGIIGAADIAKMKPGAILVNTSRGPLIDQAALLEALQARRIVAALDVYDQEPLPPAHPLRRAPNTVLSPHLGYVTRDNMVDFYTAAVENIVAWIQGAPVRVVNQEVLTA
ncbi:D-2-hydroxyacid dehydrogenase family protein [Limobrevibacterium gyesilva]|uniref:D-2-hydroxyacid dehydrogenase family protein n=1 Tax=Limobrevibacterium gyesilva TaxID=2991712 RepID=A0AA41YK04_9PROT|nr:D-2-hydroxyacid dehydrogenase family protein [Limobrevibacterium gyesilva]MCW3474000.1 D-2-hydroxyacid dehydrogenase family protein [Limobrevibacterium gyesilva]